MDREELRYWMGSIYLSLIALWILIVIIFGFFNLGLPGILICAIPFIAFTISMYFTDDREEDDEPAEVVTTGFLSFCLLIVAILSNWNSKRIGEKTSFFQIIVAGVVLIMLSMIEIWVPRRYNAVMKYYRSGLRTLGFTLFIMALYKYYNANATAEGDGGY